MTEQTIRKYFSCRNIQEHKIIGTSSSEPCQHFYLPGGCAILLQGPMVGQVPGHGKDNIGMGGSDTTYHQQLCILRKQGITSLQPQIQWDKGFTSFLKGIPTQDDDLNLRDLISARHGHHTPVSYTHLTLPTN
eukprot:3762693-Ditylum_brightwellii.AAC.1